MNASIDVNAFAELNNRQQTAQMIKADALQMWEALISYRISIGERVLGKFDESSESTKDHLTETMFDMQFKLNEK